MTEPRLRVVTEPPRDRSLGELFSDLSGQASELVHQEIELAKAEMTEKAQGLSAAGAFFVGAGVAGLLTLGTLTAMLILVLALAMDAWIAAAIMTAFWLVVTVVLGYVGRQRYQQMGTPVPEQTIETVKEDIQWAKNPTGSGRR